MSRKDFAVQFVCQLRSGRIAQKIETMAIIGRAPVGDRAVRAVAIWSCFSARIYNESGDGIGYRKDRLGRPPLLNKREAAYWMSKIMQIYIKPVTSQLGIPLKGRHTLSHSYTTLLRQTGTTPKLFRICSGM